MAGAPPRTLLGELTVLPQTPLLHWGREEKEKEGKGREDRKAEEKGREGHGEEVRGGEKGREEGKEWAPTFWVKFTPVAVSNMC